MRKLNEKTAVRRIIDPKQQSSAQKEHMTAHISTNPCRQKSTGGLLHLNKENGRAPAGRSEQRCLFGGLKNKYNCSVCSVCVCVLRTGVRQLYKGTHLRREHLLRRIVHKDTALRRANPVMRQLHYEKAIRGDSSTMRQIYEEAALRGYISTMRQLYDKKIRRGIVYWN